MNIFKQYCSLLVIFAFLDDVIEFGEAYKVIRPYKYYHRRPWRRPRWHTSHRLPKLHHSKRTPSKDYSYRKPGYYRYRPANEELVDQSTEDQPYTIVIQLPKKSDNYNRHYQRSYERDSGSAYNKDNDYIEDEEDTIAKTLNVDNKKVRIKMLKGDNPKLHIKISRVDDDNDIEIIDKSNMTAMDIPLPTKFYTNLSLSMQPLMGDRGVNDSAVPLLNELQRK